MGKEKQRRQLEAKLRQRAEVALTAGRTSPAAREPSRGPEKLIHELHVYQIELEMQNRELREAQQMLEESRDRYVDLYEFAPVGYLTFDTGGIIRDLNLTAANMLGLERPRLLGMPFRKWVAKEAKRDFLHHVKQVCGSNQAIVIEIRMTSGTDRPLQVRLESTAAADVHGTKSCRTAMIDITERKRAEQILKESEEQFRSITQSANDAIVSIDSAANVVSWNAAAERTFGYSESEILGAPLTRLMPPQYRAAHAAGMHRLSSGETSPVLAKTRELEGLRKNGATFPIELSLSTWTVQGTRYFTGIVRDITERREKEVQLLQAHKMDVLGQLTGGIAHDFNNLLTIILGNLQFLKETVGQDPQTRELVDDALSAARDGGELTQRLLAFSRKQTLQPRRIDINGLLGELDRFLRRTLRADIALQIHQARDVSAVLADPGQLENALLNLAINARDAMPKGGTLTIETSRQPIGADDATTCPELVPGDYVKVSVSDTGIGMTPEQAARAVEPFFTTKPHGQGSGLGLSMVYGFVRQSGGDLRFSSERGKGTTVSMLLPEAAPVTEEDKEQEPPQDPTGGTETVLVLEDQSQVRKFAERSLKSLGYRVLGAKDAAAALKILQEEPTVDLLFSDIVLPGAMNGRELARWAVENQPGLKVLLTTGFSDSADGDSPADAIEFPRIQKPYSKERLANMVRIVLHTR